MLRTVGLLAVAAVLGLVGGTAVGYGIHADREPTALPPLNQPGLAYPAKPLAVVTQTRKGGTLTVPFQQTVALQAQLLG
ncbi:hypothetical protein [Streptomyces sp. NPDC002185]|uniref:hypothetical protein n=1 Tax=unclassified Streptomyces TaxID=2593676 RepID=UPI0036CBA356